MSFYLQCSSKPHQADKVVSECVPLGRILSNSFGLLLLSHLPGFGESGFRVQGQLVRNFIRRLKAGTILAESSCRLLQLNHRIGDRVGRKVERLGRRVRLTEGFFQPSWAEQSEQSKAGRTDHKCMRGEPWKENAFPLRYFKSFFSHINVELSVENVEEFVLARMYMRRRL